MSSSDRDTEDRRVFSFIKAPFWKRFAAWIIDQFVLAGVILAITLLGLYQLPGGGIESFSTEILKINIIFNLAYFTVLEGIWGQSAGKSVLGISVHGEDGSRVGFGTALLRRIGLVIPLLSLIDGGAILFTSKNQRIFDIIAGTLVLRTEFESEGVRFLKDGEVTGRLVEEPRAKSPRTPEDKNRRTIAGLKETREELEEKHEAGELDEDTYLELKRKYDSRIRLLGERTED